MPQYLRLGLVAIASLLLSTLPAGGAKQSPTSKPAQAAKAARAKNAAPPAVGAPAVDSLPTLVQVQNVRRAVEDLCTTFGPQYPRGQAILDRLTACEKSLPDLLARAGGGDLQARQELLATRDFCNEALLANPLLNFDKLLLVRRNPANLGLPHNWQSNSTLPRGGFDNELMRLSPVSPRGELTSLYRPPGDSFIGDVDLNFNGKTILFSAVNEKKRWAVYEADADGKNPHKVTSIDDPDVDCYDACYLPDGNILFTSTAPFIGVPCVRGSSHVATIFRLDRDTGKVRQLTFDQEHNWCPTVLPNGRILYLRWEYSDLPHYVSRILFHMNPDGTEQMEYYGSNSYWPNAMFYARPVPGSSSKFVAVIGGHHGVPRMGELVLFDAAKGRHESGGVIQRIPGYGKKVEPIILDQLVNASWPKYLHPYPLSEKYFITSCQPSPGHPWGIYLVDVFDNRTLVKEIPGQALLEPLPLRETPRPPVIASKVQLDRKDANVYLADIYAGPGLKGVPRGTVKKLRLLSYNFSYHGMGGQVDRVGLDGPWDVKRIVGTVPVEEDGSAFFRVPANMPIAVQPLDEQGQALQLMRSWMTAMPGEVLSCVGCHESQNSTPAGKASLASRRAPSEIAPWYGPMRGFSFEREVQPALDKNCIGCHNGQVRPDGKALPNFTARPWVHPEAKNPAYTQAAAFSPSYLALRAYIRGHTMESDIRLLTPNEFRANTTELIQKLKEGHHNVQLDEEAWSRLYTWIDLNTPFHGTWLEMCGPARVENQRQRRMAMLKLYANRDDDPEKIYNPYTPPKALPPAPKEAAPPLAALPACEGWPFDAAEASRRQQADGPAQRIIELTPNIKLSLVRIPAGRFVMGSATGNADETPATAVSIDKPFWMGSVEITNEQYALFDPAHDSGLERAGFLQFSIRERGDLLNTPHQPVCRISWNEAMAFCRWLSQKSGMTFTLPTEAQWEYACRAGTATPMYFGIPTADFSKSANLADLCLRHMMVRGSQVNHGMVPPWRPAIETINDSNNVSASVGSYKPNAWGVFDMHGNAAEWTLSAYRPYPYRDGDGRNDPASPQDRVVRGGSWYDRPAKATSSARLAYPAWQKVFCVGFRVVSPIQ